MGTEERGVAVCPSGVCPRGVGTEESGVRAYPRRVGTKEIGVAVSSRGVGTEVTRGGDRGERSGVCQ